MPESLRRHAEFAANFLQRSPREISGTMSKHQLGLADRQCRMSELSQRLQDAVTMLCTSLYAARQGDEVVRQAADIFCQDMTRKITGERPSALATRAFDIALVLHADHELNASTFAARVAAATLTDMYSAIVGAIGALKGPLHGGANADVMRLLIDIGQDAPPEKIDEAIRSRLARKVKSPGFGHRVYRTEDPRATHLRRTSKELGEKAVNTRWFEMSRRIELQANCFAGMFLTSVSGKGSVSASLARQAQEDFKYAIEEKPEDNAHGSAANQAQWATAGFKANSTAACNTFAAPPAQVS